MQSKITIDNQLYEFELDMTASHAYQLGHHVVVLSPLMPDRVQITLGDNSSQYTSASDLGEWLACVKTGNLYRLNFYKCEELEIMKEQHVCFGVAFWIVLAKRYAGNPLWFRIDGVSYSCRPDAICEGRGPRRSDNMRGFGGRVFKIQKDDKVLMVDDLWCNGDIPAWFAVDYPDNASWSK